MTDKNLCDSCTNIGCEFQSGIVRTKCAFYMPPQLEPNNCGNYVVQEPTTKNDLVVDCISRQAVLDLWHLRLNDREIYKAIYDMPSVNPQPKTGRWIAQDIHNCHTNFKCSECGYIHSFMHLYGKPTADYTYCPNCGAKMEN